MDSLGLVRRVILNELTIPPPLYAFLFAPLLLNNFIVIHTFKVSLTLGADIPPDPPIPFKSHKQISRVLLMHTIREQLVLDQ